MTRSSASAVTWRTGGCGTPTATPPPEAAAAEEIDAAWDTAEATTVPPDHFFDHVYAEPTPRMVVQRAELRARLGLDDAASPPGA